MTPAKSRQHFKLNRKSQVVIFQVKCHPKAKGKVDKMKTIFRILLTTLFLTITTSALAHGPYIGPTFLIQDLTTSNSDFRGVSPRFAFGYDGIIDCYYLGAEVFATPTTLTMQDNHPVGSTSLKISRDFGISILPGLYLSEGFIGYLRLGVIRSKFKDPGNLVTGGQGGIGLQTSLSPAWVLRTEYIYTGYSHISGLGSPQSDVFGIGLIYKFDH
jgi:hypothetical protein